MADITETMLPLSSVPSAPKPTLKERFTNLYPANVLTQIVYLLGLIAILCIVGAVILGIMNRPTPDSIIGCLFTCVGALAGVVNSTHKDGDEPKKGK